MSAGAFLDRAAQRAEYRYQGLLQMQRGALADALMGSDPFHPSRVAALRQTLQDQARVFFQVELLEWRRAIAELLRADDNVLTLRDLLSDLWAQIQRDANLTEATLRNMTLEVDLLMSVNAWSRAASVIAVRQKRLEVPHNFRDRASHRWPSAVYVGLLLRHHLLLAYNDQVLREQADRGAQWVEIEHPVPSHPAHGRRLRIIAGKDGEPTYQDERERWFHPRSRALLRKSVVN